jgi:hypothetical protein
LSSSSKVFEFVSDAHTPKNNLIVAEKDGRTGRDREAVLKQIAEVKAMFGVERHYLEGLLELWATSPRHPTRSFPRRRGSPF